MSEPSPNVNSIANDPFLKTIEQLKSMDKKLSFEINRKYLKLMSNAQKQKNPVDIYNCMLEIRKEIKTEIALNIVKMGLKDQNSPSINIFKFRIGKLNKIYEKLSGLSKLLKDQINQIVDKPIEKRAILSPEPKGKTKKLIWNGQSNTLIHLFYQLKKTNGKDNRPLLNNTIEDIANFLKESFECFENTKVNTIMAQLKKTAPPQKSTKTIQISI